MLNGFGKSNVWVLDRPLDEIKQTQICAFGIILSHAGKPQKQWPKTQLNWIPTNTLTTRITVKSCCAQVTPRRELTWASLGLTTLSHYTQQNKF